MKKIIKIVLICFALLTLPTFAGNFEDGMKLYASKDYTGAAELFKKSAKQGIVEAQYNLAIIYASGKGVTQDYQQAATWYHKAAEQGHAQAQYNLGLLYTPVDKELL